MQLVTKSQSSSSLDFGALNYSSIPWKLHGTPWNSIKLHGTSIEFPRGPMDLSRLAVATPQGPMTLHGSITFALKSRGLPWDFMEVHGLPWYSASMENRP